MSHKPRGTLQRNAGEVDFRPNVAKCRAAVQNAGMSMRIRFLLCLAVLSAAVIAKFVAWLVGIDLFTIHQPEEE